MITRIKTLLCLCFVCLFITSSTISYAGEDTIFSEFPNSQEVFIKELRMQNKALHNCKGLKQCIFIIEFSKVLRSNINTLSNNVEPFHYIRKQYGNENYDFIISNIELIDLKFDEWLTKELIDYNGGKILSEDNGFTSEQVKAIYFDYISKIGFDKLYNLRKNSKTLKDKALYSYEMYLMFSSIRLYSIN